MRPSVSSRMPSRRVLRHWGETKRNSLLGQPSLGGVCCDLTGYVPLQVGEGNRRHGPEVSPTFERFPAFCKQVVFLVPFIFLSNILCLRQALLFSILSAEFIICDIIIQHWLGPTNLANTLEQDATLGGTDPLAPISNVPANAFRARAICSASLVVALHVAFITVFGKRWILDYTRVTLEGDIVDRVKERQVKLIGLKKWGFRLVTTSSFMAGFVLILFWTALTVYVWDLNDYFLRAMTMIVLAATVATVGNTFYMHVVAVA